MLEVKKSLRGRPSKFDSVDKEQLQVLVLKGFTDVEISKFFKINEATFNDWKKQHADFYKSLKDWKYEADIKVEKSLYELATGYCYDEVCFEKSKPGGLGIGFKDGEVSEIKHAECYKVKVTTKHVVPNVVAQIFWLKNRKKEEWRDKVDVSHGIEDGLIEKFKDASIDQLTARLKNIIEGSKN